MKSTTAGLRTLLQSVYSTAEDKTRRKQAKKILKSISDVEDGVEKSEMARGKKSIKNLKHAESHGTHERNSDN